MKHFVGQNFISDKESSLRFYEKMDLLPYYCKLWK